MFRKIKERIIAFIGAETKKALVACEGEFKNAVAQHVESVFAVERVRLEAYVQEVQATLSTIKADEVASFRAAIGKILESPKAEPSLWHAPADVVTADHALRRAK